MRKQLSFIAVVVGLALPGVASAQWSGGGGTGAGSSIYAGGQSSGGAIGGGGAGNKSNTFLIGRAGGAGDSSFADYTKMPPKTEHNGEPAKLLNAGTLRPGQH